MGELPGFSHIDHVGLTVPDLNEAVSFYTSVMGGTELFRLGPFGPDTHPPLPDGRDWSEAHINVPGAVRTFAMINLGANMMLELFQFDAPDDRRTDPPRNCHANPSGLANSGSYFGSSHQRGIAFCPRPAGAIWT